MKDNWKEEYLEKVVEELNDRIDELTNENERLRAKDREAQETIKAVKQVEFEYYKKLEEIKKIKEKYKELLSELRSMKLEYTSKFNDTIKDIKSTSA